MNGMYIVPITVWTKDGQKQANIFEVRWVTYSNNAAKAGCHLWANNEEVSSMIVDVTEQQCQNWTDDSPFYQSIATSIGLTPM
jgi:hypothetical protein